MTIQHNMQAMFANRELGITTYNKAKSQEKLSSGYKINRAADDAAGLTISEGMRRQIRGLDQGVKNTQDGVSLCQVADGALDEVSKMLHRITELSIKSSNGTNTAEDRQAIQSEIQELVSEIDRISSSTHFNEHYIFRGMESTAEVNECPEWLNNNYVDTRSKMVSDIRNSLADASDPSITIDYKKIGRQDYPEEGFGVVIDKDITQINVDRQGGTITIRDGGSLTIQDCNLEGTKITVEGSGTLRFIGENTIGGICMKDNSSLDIEGNGTLNVGWSQDTRRIGANGYRLGGALYSGMCADEHQVFCAENTSVTMKSGNINFVCDTGFIGPGSSASVICVDRLSIDGANVYVQNTGAKHGIISEKFDRVTHDGNLTELKNGSLIAVSPDGNIATGNANVIYDSTVSSDFVQTGGLALFMAGNFYDSGDGSEEWVSHGQPGAENTGRTTDNRNYYLNISQSYHDNYRMKKTSFGDLSLWIQSGANAGDGMYLKIDTMNTNILGIDDLDASTQSGALSAIKMVDTALEKVSANRSRIGAQQNRLEHTIDNENNIVENTTAAESRIRDADMATEMMKFTKDNILQQAGMAMLSQTNQSRQGILSLLQ